MIDAVRILRDQSIGWGNHLKFENVYSELSGKNKSLLLNYFPINRLYGETPEKDKKSLPPEVVEEMRFVIQEFFTRQWGFEDFIILENKLSKRANIVVASVRKDNLQKAKWYLVAAFGDDDYLNKAGQAIADSEKPKDDLPKNRYLWASITAITVLVAMIFMYGNLAWVNKWWPFTNTGKVHIKVTQEINSQNGESFEYGQRRCERIYRQEINGYLLKNLASGVDKRFDNTPLLLPLDWIFLEHHSRYYRTIKEKFPNAVRAEVVVKLNWLDKQRVVGFFGKVSSFRYGRAVFIRCFLENGDVYEVMPCTQMDGGLEVYILDDSENNWHKLPQY